MSSNAVLENVRRYQAIASLYRQTAAFRPLQRRSLLGEAERWEHLALSELEAYFSTQRSPRVHEQSAVRSYDGNREALAFAA
jgi:transcription initiation factor TFIIIB Brf1 subunit/transcription initiation factor TFIIB